ncbi:MAG: Lateral flagellin [Candidatus Dactylopiibacterium carminicum]|nr:MAG: Lateral flagellin [Candidatus Dactylopiibacterium carminicum]
MLSINTNAAALVSQNSLSKTQSSLPTSMTRLGTGYRVNSAMDDAAGLQIATRLKAQTSGMAVAQKNTQNGISMMQTAEGVLSEVTEILQRMKDLATEAYTASTTTDDQTALQGEYDALGEELANIIKNTSFGGATLFSDGTAVDGSGGKLSDAMTFQIGASSGETMEVDLNTLVTALATALTSSSTKYEDGTAGAELSATGTNAIIDTLSDALDAVGSLRSGLGAASNRLEHVYNNLANMSTNTEQAAGRIMDVDYASETATMTSQQILLQASTTMLKQASSMSQMVLTLIQ